MGIRIYDIGAIEKKLAEIYPDYPIAYLIGYIESLESQLKIHNPEIKTLPERLQLM